MTGCLVHCLVIQATIYYGVLVLYLLKMYKVFWLGGGVSSSEQVQTGLQYWPPDDSSRDQGCEFPFYLRGIDLGRMCWWSCIGGSSVEKSREGSTEGVIPYQ